MKGNFRFTDEDLKNRFSWPSFQGFVGDKCLECESTVNVLRDNPGWFCECGAYNRFFRKHSEKLHDNPGLGPSRQRIESIKNSVKRN